MSNIIRAIPGVFFFILGIGCVLAAYEGFQTQLRASGDIVGSICNTNSLRQNAEIRFSVLIRPDTIQERSISSSRTCSELSAIFSNGSLIEYSYYEEDGPLTELVVDGVFLIELKSRNTGILVFGMFLCCFSLAIIFGPYIIRAKKIEFKFP